LSFDQDAPNKSNYERNKMIRICESPKSIEAHFVKNDIDPTGLGEPLFPPVFAALANALYKASGKRFYDQPFGYELDNQMTKM